MKVNFINNYFLDRIDHVEAVNQIKEKDLFDDMLKDLKEADSGKTRIIQKYISKVKTIVFHGSKIYGWRDK